MKKAELIELIKNTFAMLQIPDKQDIVYDNTGYHSECIETREAFADKLWYNLDSKFILENRDGIHFFTPNAFRYFLPAFLMATIRNYAEMDDVPARVVSILTLPELADALGRKWFLEKMAIFTEEQGRIIIKYLKYMRQYKNDLYGDPQIAYKKYWVKFGYAPIKLD